MLNRSELLNSWGMKFASPGDDLLITGSPNRTETRFLFQNEHGDFYIAEGYAAGKKDFQIRQNLLLEFMAANRLPGIYPFLRTAAGEHGVLSGGQFWQIRAYIPAENIRRETLGEQEDHGILWGNFLLQMKSVTADPNVPAMPNTPFYMSAFLPKLMALAAKKMPSATGELLKIGRSLADFFHWERKTGMMFAHGDFHPGNILTAAGQIKTVIDWEFCGMKFPGYDMALLIGCLAMDCPDNLCAPAVQALQNTLYRNDFMPGEAWELLPQMIAATRLGWLGEWLSMDDFDLVLQELALLDILLNS